MIGGIYFDLKINGKIIPIDSEQDLVKLRTYIDECLSWVRHTPKFYAPPVSLSLPFPETEETDKGDLPPAVRQLLERPSISQVEEQLAPITTIDYAVKALGYLDGEATISDAFRTAIEFGWKTRAKDLKNAMRTFTIMVRQNSELVKVYKGVMSLTPAGYEKYTAMLEQEYLAHEASSNKENSAPITGEDAKTDDNAPVPDELYEMATS